MTPEKWNKIKALFASAQDYPESERSRFLSHACGDDGELKREVERLLDSHSEDDDFLENSAVEQIAGDFEGDTTAAMGRSYLGSALPRFEKGILLNGRYEILRLLGRGGMGEVYLANDKRISRNVALKVLHPDFVSNKESLRRFALEAQAVSALNHPHIMTIHEFDTAEDGTLFFVAEYVDGHTLDHLIGKPMSLEKALEIAVQVSSALSAAHDAGITHRDIKPENIMVRRDGYIKVLDFGLAKLTQLNSLSDPSPISGSEDATRALHRTKPGLIMGTASYMSPEQARGIEVDARTDVWSLGVVLYEMITGHRPFSGGTSADIIVSVLSKEPPEISDFVEDLPAGLESVILRSLSKDVEGRYQTSSELRADLIKIKKRLEVSEELGRSGSTEAATQALAADNMEQAVPTSGGNAKPTSGGRSESKHVSAVWSFPGISMAFQSAGEHKLRSSVIAILLFSVLFSTVYFLFLARPENSEINSIAVLPFENLSGDPDLTFVSDGISDGVIDRLSELPQLKVISRNSSFKFRDTRPDLRSVAFQLGVRAILTGSVSRIGEDLVVRYDLVDASNDRQITGGQIRQKIGTALLIQNEIARAASEQLRLKLTDSQSKRLSVPGTENSEAFRYYLSGLVELNGGPADMQTKALNYFEQAVTLDPNYAAAYTEIGWIYWYQANGNEDPHELMPKAKAAAERALAIDPNLAKAHVIMATVREFEFDWPGAEREYLRAIELSPSLAEAHNSYALYLSVMGRQQEAMAELDKQGSLDPINRNMTLLWKAAILAGARRFDDALEVYKVAKSLEPEKEIQPIALGYAYAGKGQYEDAAVYYKKAADAFGGEDKYSQPLVYLAATYAKIPEKRNEAFLIMKKIDAMPGYKSPALLAVGYSALGEKGKALDLLEQAYVERDLLLRYVGTGYEYDELRGDPRFVELTKRIGLGR